MPGPVTTTWEPDEHTIAKHRILRGYLDAWFGIIGNGFHRAVYIDGFCGPGRHPTGEPGSPLVALEAALPHCESFYGGIDFHFVDHRQDRIDYLNHELAILPITLPESFRIHVKKLNFTELIGPLLRRWQREDFPPPVFAFIDPLGFSGIPFDTVQQLLALPATEIFINIMINYINRFLRHPNKNVRLHMAIAFGTDEVFDIAKSEGDRVKALIDLYGRRLKSDTMAEHMIHFNMINKSNNLLYSLFFATKHPLGHEKMKDAMWEVDPQGEFAFRDPRDKDAGQLSLFLARDVAEYLLDIICDQYAGASKVLVCEVWDFANRETIYQQRHLRMALKFGEGVGRIKVQDYKADGTRRVRGYPENAVLSFC